MGETIFYDPQAESEAINSILGIVFNLQKLTEKIDLEYSKQSTAKSFYEKKPIDRSKISSWSEEKRELYDNLLFEIKKLDKVGAASEDSVFYLSETYTDAERHVKDKRKLSEINSSLSSAIASIITRMTKKGKIANIDEYLSAFGLKKNNEKIIPIKPHLLQKA
ncbi:MAG: hypothetical protein ABIH83_04890 [Candidatus Micrarchaeota archaeon]